MTEEANGRRRGATRAREPEAAKASADSAIVAKQIQVFIDEHPLLSLGFVVAAGYAAGRILSKL
jgi:hypothetical protein